MWIVNVSPGRHVTLHPSKSVVSFFSILPDGSSANLQGEIRACGAHVSRPGPIDVSQPIRRGNRMPASVMVSTVVLGELCLATKRLCVTGVEPVTVRVIA